ncbi:MAG TPA: hypothetical protein VJ861_11775 [Treponemataceae bacterium]|nr:hypothetical protein [Treponemataceae bacterium]
MLFFLDGDFLAGKGMQDYERLQKANLVMPAIIICIGYGRCENFLVRDLTPTSGAPNVQKESWCKNPGGAEVELGRSSCRATGASLFFGGDAFLQLGLTPDLYFFTIGLADCPP